MRLAGFDPKYTHAISSNTPLRSQCVTPQGCSHTQKGIKELLVIPPLIQMSDQHGLDGAKRIPASRPGSHQSSIPSPVASCKIDLFCFSFEKHRETESQTDDR